MHQRWATGGIASMGHGFERLDRRTPMLVGLAIGGVAPVGAGTGATFRSATSPFDQSVLRSPAFQLMIPKADRRASSLGIFFSSATLIASRTIAVKSSI